MSEHISGIAHHTSLREMILCPLTNSCRFLRRCARGPTVPSPPASHRRNNRAWTRRVKAATPRCIGRVSTTCSPSYGRVACRPSSCRWRATKRNTRRRWHEWCANFRAFPRSLLAANEPQTTYSLLALGRQGVQSLVDVRDPKGWRDLRQLISNERGDTIEQLAIVRIREDLLGVPADCQRFFECLFRAATSVTTVRQLARGAGVLPSTFMSRFFRARLPAPKRYLAAARLVRAARLFENTGLSITHVANYLEYSSPQSFSRHVQTVLSCTALEFRRSFDGERMLNRMRDDLVLPYRDILRRFEPFVTTPQWSALRS